MTTSNDNDDCIELSIKSRLQNVSAITLCARSLAEYFGLPPEKVMQIELAVSEAVTNVIEHAYDSRADQPIVVKLAKQDDMMEIRLMDQGTELDSGRLEQASSMFDQEVLDPMMLLAESGRGLGLIQSMMDEVKVIKENDWNVLLMKKAI